MSRGSRIILNLVICGLLAAFALWHNGWYMDKDECFAFHKIAIQLPEGILIGETDEDHLIHRIVYHEESDTFSVLEMEKMLMLTRFGNSYKGVHFAESDLKAFGVMFHECSESRQMVVVFQRYDDQVDKVEIECKDGQKIIIDQWNRNFYVYSTSEYLRPMYATYYSYDQDGNLIDEMRWG